MSIRNLLLAALAVAGAPAVLAPVPAGATHRLECQAPVDLVKLSRPLARVSARLLRREDITILALGSSSTYGTGASRSEFSYPSRLEQELHTLLPKTNVKVVNRGVGGEDARGYRKLFLDTVTQADRGCDFDFLAAPATIRIPR